MEETAAEEIGEHKTRSLAKGEICGRCKNHKINSCLYIQASKLLKNVKARPPRPTPSNTSNGHQRSDGDYNSTSTKKVKQSILVRDFRIVKNGTVHFQKYQLLTDLNEYIVLPPIGLNHWRP